MPKRGLRERSDQSKRMVGDYWRICARSMGDHDAALPCRLDVYILIPSSDTADNSERRQCLNFLTRNAYKARCN